MAVQNKSITILGASTAVSQIVLQPQANGSVSVVVMGGTANNLGELVPLNPASLALTGVAAVDNMVARALTELRKANGLET